MYLYFQGSWFQNRVSERAGLVLPFLLYCGSIITWNMVYFNYLCSVFVVEFPSPPSALIDFVHSFSRWDVSMVPSPSALRHLEKSVLAPSCREQSHESSAAFPMAPHFSHEGWHRGDRS